ncbi:uncharacterized protein LOC124404460 [Diprion similis]|uniref:uncharacterized protein LOC124404460 n=1 Tax=Diprion similis TaxID=362088 RepID=UPI001EF80D17|nr:uncharacterized protein LOC124404460 [Diprion similis]
MNFRLNICLLLTLQGFVVGIASAPTSTDLQKNQDTQKLSDGEAEAKNEQKPDTRGLSIPFLPSNESPASGSGLSGLPNVGSMTSGAKMYLGAFQVMAMPMPSLSGMAEMLGNLANLPASISSIGNLGGLNGGSSTQG